MRAPRAYSRGECSHSNGLPARAGELSLLPPRARGARMGDAALQRVKLVLAGLPAGLALFFLGMFAGRAPAAAPGVLLQPVPTAATPSELKIYVSGAVVSP